MDRSGRAVERKKGSWILREVVPALLRLLGQVYDAILRLMSLPVMRRAVMLW